MASQWFIARDGVQVASATSVELMSMARDGRLRPTDHLWKDGMAEWQLASTVSKLFPTEGAVTIASPSEAEADCGDSPAIIINTSRYTPRRKIALPKPAPTGRYRPRQHSHTPQVILGIKAEKWIAWLPWAMVWASIGSVLAALAMRASMLLAAFFIKGIRLPVGVGGRPTVEEPLLWKVAFFLCIAQAVAGLVAFPMLRSQKATGWAIALGSALAWILYETLELLASPRPSLFVLLPLLSAIAVAFALWQLRFRYGVAGGGHVAGEPRRIAPLAGPILSGDDTPISPDDIAFPGIETAERIWQSVKSTATSLPAINLTELQSTAKATVEKLNREIKTIVPITTRVGKNASSTTGWLKVGGVALLCIAVIGSCFGGNGGGGKRGGGGRQDNLDGCAWGASEEYKEGYARMVRMAKAFDRERRYFRDGIGDSPHPEIEAMLVDLPPLNGTASRERIWRLTLPPTWYQPSC